MLDGFILEFSLESKNLYKKKDFTMCFGRGQNCSFVDKKLKCFPKFLSFRWNKMAFSRNA